MRSSSVMANMILGAAIGAAVTIAGTKLIGTNKRTVKKSLAKAARTVSDLVDNVTYMIK